MNFIRRLFKKDPEMVLYGEKGGKQLARPRINEKTGEIETEIKGEKYALRAHPRHSVMHGPMAEMKRWMKNLVIEQMTQHIDKVITHKILKNNGLNQ